MSDVSLFEAVYAHPDGEATVSRLALTAAEYGFDGVVVRNHGDEPADYDVAAVEDRLEVAVVDGVEIRTEDPSRASGYLGNYPPEKTVVAVHGGTDAMNRFAVEQPSVDVLAHPTADDATVDQVLARTAAENGVRLELSLAPVLGEPGGGRVRAIEDLRRLWELVEQYDAPYVVTAGANSHLDVRAPRELAALGETIGMSAADVTAGLAEWAIVAERNWERQDDSFVEPGVRRESGDDR